MKVSYLITVKIDKRYLDMVDGSDVDDYLTDIINMPGVKYVSCIPVHNRIAKYFRRLLGF